MNIMYTEDSGNATPPVSHCDHNKIKAAAVTKLFIPSEIRYNHLITSVYHKPAAEPYVVPFTSDHPRHVFANIIQGALLRAVSYSSTLKEFNHERRAIKLMLLYNGYSIYNCIIC